MLLSPSRADCIIFELEALAALPVPDSDAAEIETAVRPLYTGKWNALPLPVAVVSSAERATANAVLAKIGWGDLPASRVACAEPEKIAAAVSSLCRSLNARWPLMLAASSAAAASCAGINGDLVAVGKDASACPIRFSTAADALRAILGIV